MCGMEVSNKLVTFVAYCLLQSSSETGEGSRRANNSVALIASIWSWCADRMLSYTLMKWKWNETPSHLARAIAGPQEWEEGDCVVWRDKKLSTLAWLAGIVSVSTQTRLDVLSWWLSTVVMAFLFSAAQTWKWARIERPAQIQMHLWPNSQNRNDCPLSSAKSWKMLEWLWCYSSAGWPSDQSFQALDENHARLQFEILRAVQKGWQHTNTGVQSWSRHTQHDVNQ